MTECPILLKTSQSTSNFPFGSQTGFLGVFNGFFLSWFRARYESLKPAIGIFCSILLLISGFHALSFVFRGLASVVSRPTRPTRVLGLSVYSRVCSSLCVW